MQCCFSFFLHKGKGRDLLRKKTVLCPNTHILKETVPLIEGKDSAMAKHLSFSGGI